MLEQHFRTTPAEREVLRLLACGLSDKVIAEELRLSLDAVGRRLERFYARTGLHGRAAVAWATQSLNCCLMDTDGRAA